jgi:hypothetical protein
MEMKFGKTGFARRLVKQNTGLVFGGEEITSATESTEGIVMEMLRHERMILLPAVVSAPRLRGTESPSDILGAARIRKGKTVRIRHPRTSRVAASHEGRTTPLSTDGSRVVADPGSEALGGRTASYT